MSSRRYLLVTIDTEVDKAPDWRISSPVQFRSVCEGVPRIFSPLFAKYGVKPTYFLSPEVIEHPRCVEALQSLGERAELATHLHSELIDPDRRLFPEGMAGARADAIQRQLPRQIEAQKLANLTDLFRRAFGAAPTAFRAGRYGVSDSTYEILAELGYKVDSSVTPGLRWDYAEGEVDFRDWKPGPQWLHTPAGRILELPLSIRPRGIVARWARPLIGERRAFQWLRPSWSSGESMIHYVESSDERFLNLMFHSMEVIPGASPYARTEAEAARIVESMDVLFKFCARSGVGFCGVSDVVNHV
jgi:peptidoglycan/xylan/chitin deacetylase (PgdA/CDA1 family)